MIPAIEVENSQVGSQSIISEPVNVAVARLDAWFETMRGSTGYGGPVSHWWQQSLVYTGTGLDWRYEGIIAGYIQLWERTNDELCLLKARRAGNDLVAAQFENGHFPASSFEMNPASAGTPHEAACDVGLLLLALSLQKTRQTGWEIYLACAERNLRLFYIEQLWDADVQYFRDNPHTLSFVPNKAATACEALFLLAELTGDSQWVERYAIPTLKQIVAHQVDGGDRLDGAIAQNSFGARRIEKYFPVYIARCISALLRGYRWTNDEQYADCALRAMAFISRWAYGDGSFPTVVYPDERVNRYPSWIAPLGDVLRAADELRPFGFGIDLSMTVKRLLTGQDETGGIQTAYGFASQTNGAIPSKPDVRDILHVAGWCDKAFRFLASQAGPELPEVKIAPFEAACTFRGKSMHFVETSEMLEISFQGGACYRWHKGEPWVDIAAPEFWLR